MRIGLILLGLICASWIYADDAKPLPNGERPIIVRVLVLNFDPVIPQEGNKRLHEVGKWNDPRWLAQQYADEVRKASGDLVRYQIVEWRDLDEFPVKVDGFVYTKEQYLQCLRDWKGWHEPDGMDYEKVLQKHGVDKLIDAGKVDEVWLFGAPYMGFWESAMAGPGAFFINGGVYDKFPTKRPFAIMGFNYERGVAEMLHNLCHRTEATMTRIYGGWQADKLEHNWARFAANAHQSNGVAAVGSCHYPPNGEKDYDYANPRTVVSSAPDWLNYPNFTGKTMEVNRETWGGPDYHLNYMRWWFRHLPRNPGVNREDGRLNNWWRYVFEFTQYDERGKPVRANPKTD
jgi:hypothetical protein